jgi:hypothetical protein
MKMEQSVPKRRYKFQMPGDHSIERLQHSEHGEDLKQIGSIFHYFNGIRKIAVVFLPTLV